MDYFSLQIHIPGNSTHASVMKRRISYRRETNYSKKRNILQWQIFFRIKI